MRKLLKEGFCGTIAKIDYNNPSAGRLSSMGLTPNTRVCIVKNAPLGDPVILSVRNYKLAIRKKDLEAITFKDIEDN